jgi:hypothetical protein
MALKKILYEYVDSAELFIPQMHQSIVENALIVKADRKE